jgi:hypothetical protein
MSINKLIAPDIKLLSSFLEINGSIIFFKKYVNKIDVLIGEDDDVDFIEKFEKKYHKKTMSNEVFYKLD